MEPCPDHPNGQPPAPRPDVVLVKVNLNDKWVKRFISAGIRVLDRPMERAEDLAAIHEEQAKRLGRDPFVIRERREGHANDPESADSGCPVFGVKGLQFAGIVGLVEELRGAGFRLTGFPHILARDRKPPKRLVLQFTRAGEEVAFPRVLYRELVSTCFGQVDVWANGRDDRGFVVHTVNCGKRDDSAEPEFRLSYADGDWAAKPIKQPAGEPAR